MHNGKENSESRTEFSLWLRRPKPDPQAHLRLFCFPHAGGGASLFRSWPDALPPDIEICPVQLPGRESRLLEPSFSQLSPMVQTLTEVLHAYLSVPFAFFGHSLGALISFELTRQLRRQNNPGPVYLFISGCRAPQIPDPDPPIHQLPQSAFVRELHRLNGTPHEVLQNAELMQLVLPILRADFAVYETYIYANENPLDCPISVFGGLQDFKVGHDELLAWRDQTRGLFNLRMFPGDHFFLQSAQALLLRVISQDLSHYLSFMKGSGTRDES